MIRSRTGAAGRRRSSTSAGSSSPAASRGSSASRSHPSYARTGSSTSPTPRDRSPTSSPAIASNGRAAIPASRKVLLTRAPSRTATTTAGTSRSGPTASSTRHRRRRLGRRSRESLPEHELALRQAPPARRRGRRGRAGRSSRSACATRGASRSTVRRATSGSATSGRARSRRSTSRRAAPRACDNFGWDVYEGTRAYEDKPLGPGTLVRPIDEYTHDSGCSVTGGFVYRGKAKPGLSRPLRLRRLLQRDGLVAAGGERQGNRRTARGVQGPESHVVRRGRRRRALRDVGRRHRLPAQLAVGARRLRGHPAPPPASSVTWQHARVVDDCVSRVRRSSEPRTSRAVRAGAAAAGGAAES